MVRFVLCRYGIHTWDYVGVGKRICKRCYKSQIYKRVYCNCGEESQMCWVDEVIEQ